MAIALAQHKFTDSNPAGTTQTVTVTSTVAKSVLVVTSAVSANRTVSSVTDGGDTFVQATGAAGNNGTNFVDAWYCLAGSGGKTTITVTYSSSLATSESFVEVWEVTGFKIPAFDLASTNHSNAVANTATGVALTITGAIDFIASAIINTDSITANPKSGNAFTFGGDITSKGSAACSLATSSIGTYTPAWTTSTTTDAFVTTIIAIKELAGLTTRILMTRVGI